MNTKVLLLATAMLVAPATFATAADRAYSVELKTARVGPMLQDVSRATGLQLVYTDPQLDRTPARPLVGQFTAREMLASVLDGTGYAYRFTNPNAVLIYKASTAPQVESRAAGSPVAQGDADPADEAAVDEVVVTGSRIARSTLTTAVPVMVTNQEQLEASGFTDLTEALADLPGVGFGDTTVGTPNGTIQNAGLATVDLRGLGSNRTLTLIDGRRTVSNASNRNVVSLNTIPLDFVDRVEVITGASSAVYGSDAIAGVVNVITVSNLEGWRLKGRTGQSIGDGSGGGRETSFSASYGTRFADHRGYVLVSASYEKDEGLFAHDRMPRAGRSWTYDPTSNSVIEPDLSTDISGGRFRGGSFFYDASGLRTGFQTQRDGYNDRLLDTLRVPREVAAAAVKANYEFAPSFNVFGQLQFSDMDTVWTRAPIGIRDSTEATVRDPATGLPAPGFPRFVVGRIPLTNPLIPAQIRAGAPSNGIDFRRRFDEIGNRETFNDRDTLRAFVGVNGKVFDKWRYELSYAYGAFDQHQVRTGGVNLQDLQYALDAEADPANPGQARCRDATARANGCVPINLFGVGTITPAAAGYVGTNSIFESSLRQRVLQGFVTGDLWTLPAGPLGFAAGFEYRKEQGSLTTDDEVRTGVTTNSGVPGYDDGFDVKEAFAEFTVPLIRDQPLIKELNLDLAGRLANYSQENVGTVGSYRVGGSWAPVAGLRLRAQYGIAQRAPDLAELYSPPRDDTDTTIDICTGVTATSPGQIAANCRRESGVAAEIATAGVFRQDTTTVASPNGGNPDVAEETGTTFTLGAILQPPQIPGFALAVDYYQIKVEDAIDAYSADVILRQCYSDANFPNNAFCGLITRNSANGEIQQIVQLQQNLNELRVSGIDVHVDYRLELADIASLPGRLVFSLDYNYVIENEVDYVGINGVETSSDLNEVATPQHSGNARISYELGDLRVQWRTRFVGDTVASNDRVFDAAERGFTDPLYLEYDTYFRHDISVSYTLAGDPKVRLYGGINNIFDDAGPDVPEGATPDAINGFIPQYGIIGRTAYVGFELRF